MINRYTTLLTLLLTLCVLPAVAWAAEPEHTFSEPKPFERSFLDTSWYARLEDNANVYTAPGYSDVVRNVGDGFLYSTLQTKVTGDDGSQWYLINPGEYVRAEDLEETKASQFQGTEINTQPSRPFGWIVGEVRPSQHIGGAPYAGYPRLQRYDFFQVYDIGLDTKRGKDGKQLVWYNIGGDRWIMQHSVSIVDVTERPAEIGRDDFWVEVDLYEETMAAYEGDTMVYAGLVSSGLPQWPTREGVFQVWARLERTKMSGAEGQDDYYFIEEVPHTLYFDGEIALHGAYWHDRFGYPHSHGCVNMPPRDSEWVFNWSQDAPEALWVYVHTSDPHASEKSEENSATAPSFDQILAQTISHLTSRIQVRHYWY